MRIRNITALALAALLMTAALASCGPAPEVYDLPDPAAYFEKVFYASQLYDREKLSKYFYVRKNVDEETAREAAEAYVRLLTEEYGFTIIYDRDDELLLRPADKTGNADYNVRIDLHSLPDNVRVRFLEESDGGKVLNLVEPDEIFDPSDAPAPEPEPEPETRPEPEPEPATKPEPQPETKPEPKPEPETKPEPEPEPDPVDFDGVLPDPYSFFNGDLSYSYEAKGNEIYITFYYKEPSIEPILAYLELLNDERYGLTPTRTKTEYEYQSVNWIFDYAGDKQIEDFPILYDKYISSCAIYFLGFSNNGVMQMDIWYMADGLTFADFGDRYPERLTGKDGDGLLTGVLGTVKPGETKPSGDDRPGNSD